jgi:NAD(P)-dependent dehydrogenase (short-subunit alcohol dehydrogenase family)
MTLMNGLLSEKVALVTGAASGIGRASARLFARQGARVVLADVNDDDGRAAAAAITGEGGEALFVRTDVGQSDDIRALVDAAVERFGRLDVVFSNAGFTPQGDAVETSESDWDRTLDVCLKASYLLAHCAVPIMRRNGGGSFVITSSVHSIRGYARSTAYQAAKGGLTALTRAMAADFAPAIRVNAILPGAVQTGRPGALRQDQIDMMAGMCVMRRIGQPEDIANAALFLASDMSSYITGQSLVVDGGLTSIIQVPS